MYFMGWASSVNPVQALWFFKQLEIQPDNNLSCGNLMEQQPLRDWSFRALVLLYFSQPDLSPAQEVWGLGKGVCVCVGGGGV